MILLFKFEYELLETWKKKKDKSRYYDLNPTCEYVLLFYAMMWIDGFIFQSVHGSASYLKIGNANFKCT